MKPLHTLSTFGLAMTLATLALAQPAGSAAAANLANATAPAQATAPAMPPGAMPPGLPPGMPGFPPPELPSKVAVDIVDGRVVSSEHTRAAVVAGHVTGQGGTGLTVRSKTDQLNAVYIHGNSHVTLTSANIELAGKGKSDFDGLGAGVLVKDQSSLTLRNARITTRGIVSSTVVATDKTTLRVIGAKLVAHGGGTPSGYVRRIGPGMMEPPTPLGIVGTARTALVMGEAKAYFQDSLIIADGWGALSTDAARGAYLEADRCDIRVLRSGYATYADNGAAVKLKRSKIQAATFTGVIAGQASIALEDVRSTSQGNTVMIHSVMGQPQEVATLDIRGGQLDSLNAAILVKSANAKITVEGAKMTAGNGDLILGVVNDDSHATKVNGAQVPGIHATLRHSALEGNLLMLDTDRPMTVTLEDTRLTGRVHNSALALDAKSRWTANANSQTLLMGPLQLAQIDALPGVMIEAKATPETGLKAGRYKLASGGTLTVQ